jgi:hypothetical protein
MNGVDLVWAMDTSSSVGLKRYQSGIDFMIAVTSHFSGNIGDEPHQTRMGLFSFDAGSSPWFGLDKIKSANDIITVLKSIRSQDNNGSHTNYVQALEYAHSNMFTNARVGVQKVLVFIADGWTDETAAQILAASNKCRDDNINVWFIGYEDDYSEVKAKALVGNGHNDRVQFENVFTDVSKLTGCTDTPPPPSTGGKIDCHNHGVAMCTCKHPYYGPFCNETIGCDNVPVVINGKMTHPHLCHDHGKCIPDHVVGGGHCVCKKCWTGDWCQNLVPNCHPSQRCIAYDTDYTEANKNNPDVVQYMCDLKSERCVSDDLDCNLNVPIKDVNGRPTCNPPSAREKCKCKYPIGWCIPLETGNNIYKTLATKGFVDKFFTGSSL